MRLDIVISETLKKIYESVKRDEIQSKDLSQLLGYKFGTEPTLFKRINSMLAYGVLEGSRGIYNITQLGEDLLFLEPDKEQELKTQAVLNVGLWKELFKKNKKELPKNGLWVQLKNITGVDPDTAKKTENRISNWYTEDMEVVSDDVVVKEDSEQEPQSKPEISRSSADTVMIEPEQLNTSSLGKLTVPSMGSVEINDDTLELAKSYLKILENKLNKKRKLEISKLICVPCSSEDEENNPTSEDVELLEVPSDFEGVDDYKSWQCPKCQYKLWTKMNVEDTQNSS